MIWVFDWIGYLLRVFHQNVIFIFYCNERIFISIKVVFLFEILSFHVQSFTFALHRCVRLSWSCSVLLFQIRLDRKVKRLILLARWLIFFCWIQVNLQLCNILLFLFHKNSCFPPCLFGFQQVTCVWIPSTLRLLFNAFCLLLRLFVLV